MTPPQPPKKDRSSSMPSLLPIGGHEVPVALLLEVSNKPVVIEGSTTNDEPDHKVLLRLGTKVSDNHPSKIGFRAMLRTRSPQSQPVDTMEDAYHVISFEAKLAVHEFSHGTTSAENLQILKSIFPSVATLSPKLHEIHLQMKSGFKVSKFGEMPDVTDPVIKETLNKLELLEDLPVKMAVYFPHDHVLVDCIEKIIAANFKGNRGVMWSDTLPATVEPEWPVNIQDRMVEGSAGPVNALRSMLREPLLSDAPSTKVDERKVAAIFHSYLREIFPRMATPWAQPCLPIFLDIRGICTELPFGGSMVNQSNVENVVVLVQHLINFGLPASSIGVVTFYPGQTEKYVHEMQSLQAAEPKKGFEHIQIDYLDGWVDKTVDIAIVDLVRTQNASGNLGLLSQQRRLKVALTRHKNGLIVVGDRTCTRNLQGDKTSSKLEKVLAWFDENRRVVDANLLKPANSSVQIITAYTRELTLRPSNEPTILVGGRDLRDSNVQPPTDIPNTSGFQSMTLGDSQLPLGRTKRYVGIPELERDFQRLQLTGPETQPGKPQPDKLKPELLQDAKPVFDELHTAQFRHAHHAPVVNTNKEAPVHAPRETSKIPQPLNAYREKVEITAPVVESPPQEPVDKTDLEEGELEEGEVEEGDFVALDDGENSQPPALRFEWPSREEQPKTKAFLSASKSSLKPEGQQPSVLQSPPRGRTRVSDDLMSATLHRGTGRLQSPLRALKVDQINDRAANIPKPRMIPTPTEQAERRSKPSNAPSISSFFDNKPPKAGASASLLGEGLYRRPRTPVIQPERTKPKKENVIPAKATTNPFNPPSSSFSPKIEAPNSFAKPLELASAKRKHADASALDSKPAAPPSGTSAFKAKNLQRKTHIESMVQTLRGNQTLTNTLGWQKAEASLKALGAAFEKADEQAFNDAHANLCMELGKAMGIASGL